MATPLRQDEEAVLRARDAAFADGDLQTELPGPAEFVLPDWMRLPDWVLAIGSGLVNVLCIIISLGIIFAVGFALKRFLDGVAGRRRLREAKAAEIDLGGTRLDIDLSRIEHHASRGAYADAIHLLLLGTITELCRLARIRLDPSLTSREIVATIPMPEAARNALAGLVAAVEVSHFGDAEVGPADYENCRSRFDVFVESLAEGRR